MMHWGKIALATLAIGSAIGITTLFTAFANSIPPAGQPGSTEDPLVTKSYVDEQIKAALSGKTTTTTPSTTTDAALLQRITQLEKALSLVTDSQVEGQGTSYEVVPLPAGHTLIGGENTKMIVRIGQAIVYSNTPDNGIADVTDGVDLKNGVRAPNNHLLIIPREGRGVRVEPDYKNKVFVTVEGAFTELDASGNAILK
jgi:hypothetical protein